MVFIGSSTDAQSQAADAMRASAPKAKTLDTPLDSATKETGSSRRAKTLYADMCCPFETSDSSHRTIYSDRNTPFEKAEANSTLDKPNDSLETHASELGTLGTSPESALQRYNPLEDLPVLPTPRDSPRGPYKSFNELYMPPHEHNISLALMRLQQAQVKSLEEDIQDYSTDIDIHAKKKEELIQAKIKKLEEAIAKSKASGMWSFLGQLAQWFGSLFTTILGAVALATGVGGVIAASVMLITGSLSFLMQSASTFGIYDKIAGHMAHGDPEKKARILSQIQLWSTIGSIALAVASLAVGYKAIFQGGMKIASAAIQGTIQVVASAATMGRAVVDSQKLYLDADSKELEAFILEQKQKLAQALESQKNRLNSWVAWKRFNKQNEAITKAMDRAINRYHRGSAG